tara:strand:+ start:59 stop:439 length:381 start_codon:yes stop_codon:yes gene_type:complete
MGYFKKKRAERRQKKAEREVARSEKVASGDTALGKDRHVVTESKDNKDTQVSYKKVGSDSAQQVKTKDKETGEVKREEVETKGGTYKVYGSESKKAGSFRDAFAKAVKDGKKVFTWNGLKYSTKKA